MVDPGLALKKGELKFHLHGEKLTGKWALVRIKGDDPKAWLLVKDKDEHARPAAELDIVSARPESVLSGRGLAEVAAERDRLWHSKVVGPGGKVEPGGPAEGDGGAPLRLADLAGAVRGPLPQTQPLALAMVVEAPPAGDDWLHEIKHDGYRIVARIEEGEVRLISRNGKDWTKEFPQVARAVGRLPAGTALLDGEVAAVLPNGATSFQALQRRAEGGTPLVYFAFDLLHLDGWDLREVRLEERKEVLRRLLESAPAALRFSDHVRGHGPEFFAQARELGLEGVVSKRADAPYREGRGRRLAEVEVPAEPGGGDRRLHAVVGRPGVDRGAARGLPRGRASSCTRARSAPGSTTACSPTCSIGWRRAGERRRRSPASPPSCDGACSGSSRTSWPRSSSRSGRTRAGCASPCSSASATTARRATSCASGRGRWRAAASTRWRRAGRGRRCAVTPPARSPSAARRSSTSSACA